MKKLNRRDMMRWTLGGGGGLTLAALATGLPLSFLRTGQVAHAGGDATKNPTALILATSSSGDPLNANCPGSYPNPSDDNDPRWMVEHATVSELGDGPRGEIAGVAYGAADFAEGHLCQLGGVETWAARPWADLPEALRSRMSVLRHRTLNNAHTEFRQVTEFHGALKGPGGIGVEALPSFIAQETFQSLGTVVEAPISLGGPSYAFEGAWLRDQDPDSLQELFAQTGEYRGLLAPDFAEVRDAAVDAIYKDLRASGTHAQRRFFEGHVRSRNDARLLSEVLSSSLAPVSATDSEIEKQIIAAVALVEAGATPVVTLNFPFGGDNHQDSDLAVEVDEQIQGIGGIRRLWDELTAKNLQDDVTFAYLGVFGRTLTRQNSGGRNHYGDDHAMLMFGPHVTPGLVGQLDDGLKAGAIGDVPVEETLASAGKTLARAAGVPEAIVEQRINGGRAF